MLPFCGYHIGDYFRHWLAMGRAVARPPKIFNVNWFRTDENGKFVWPGFRQNMRVLKWIVDRCGDRAHGVETALGLQPEYRDLDWRGLDFSSGRFGQVMRLEEKYHTDHAEAWFERLARGPVTARQRFAEGLAACIGEAVALFEPLPREQALVADGVLPRPNEELLADWLARLGEVLEEASLDFVLERHGPPTGEMVPTSAGEIAGEREDLRVPGVARREGRWVHEGGFEGAGGRHGRHSEDFLPLWDEMTKLYREHPGARW